VSLRLDAAGANGVREIAHQLAVTGDNERRILNAPFEGEQTRMFGHHCRTARFDREHLNPEAVQVGEHGRISQTRIDEDGYVAGFY
jgi:hypothetical protein